MVCPSGLLAAVENPICKCHWQFLGIEQFFYWWFLQWSGNHSWFRMQQVGVGQDSKWLEVSQHDFGYCIRGQNTRMCSFGWIVMEIGAEKVGKAPVIEGIWVEKSIKIVFLTFERVRWGCYLVLWKLRLIR